MFNLKKNDSAGEYLAKEVKRGYKAAQVFFILIALVVFYFIIEIILTTV